jgi:tetratricopeptide (TPR) repeat protein
MEQVITAGPRIAELVTACPRLRVLVTSRERLRVRDETEFAVPPLNLDQAAELFARLSSLPADETVRELCRRLDQMPLAIELAAARANVLTPQQILDRLSQRLDILRGGRDAVARQHTLRAAIEWSHALLSADEQALFARLAVFSGGWDLEAAEAVAGADLDVLQTLVDKSLVQSSVGRFSMLETIREFASERLSELVEEGQIRQRHAHYYFALARTIRLASNESAGAWVRLEPEIHNVREALTWSVAHADRFRARAALSDLWYYWLAGGHVTEGDRWATRILAMPGADESLAEGRGLMHASELARFSGDLERALKLKFDAIDLLRDRAEDDRGFVARDMALILVALGRIEEAETYANEALEARTRQGTPGGIAHALFGCAFVAWHRGRADEAIDLLGRSAEMTAADSFDLAGTLEAMADFERQSGRINDATVHLSENLELLAGSGDQFELAYSFRGAGSLLADVDRPADAARAWGALDSMLRRTGQSFAEHPSDFETQQEKVRRLLGSDEFERLRQEGANLDGEDALAFVVEAVRVIRDGLAVGQ